MNVKASVSLFWQPYGFDVEATSPLSERERLENVVGLCDELYSAMSVFFPEARVKDELSLDVAVDANEPYVLEQELLAALVPALENFRVTKADYDALSDKQRASLKRVELNIDEDRLETAADDDAVIEFGAEISPAGYKGRYYYFDGSGQLKCCSTGATLLSNGQPVRIAAEGDVEAEADVLLRSVFDLIEEGGPDVA